jgi:hypothetical protein
VSKKPTPPNVGLSKQHTRRNAREFVDFDYADKLSPEELKFLEQFSREFYQSDLRRPKLHTSPEDKRKIYSANNARNRDMWNQFQRLPNDPTEHMADDEDGNGSDQ